MNNRQGILFVVSAPSGAGKTSLCRAITESMENLTHSISYTTRQPRPGELDGRDYYFVSEERFNEMIASGDFAEHARVHSNLYGTSKHVLDDMVGNGIDVILDIDTQGARQIRDNVSKAVFIFIMPPSLQILEERLRNRKSDREEDIRNRMKRAIEEIREYAKYDYTVVNRDFDRALSDLKAVVGAERCRTERTQQTWIDDMTQ